MAIAYAKQLLYLHIIVIAICKLLALIYEERYPIRPIYNNKIARFILKGSLNILYFVPKQNTESTVTDSCINGCYRVNALTVIGTQRHALHKALVTLFNN